MKDERVLPSSFIFCFCPLAGCLVPIPLRTADTATTRRRIVVLGSTGSIGTNTLEVVASLEERLSVVGLSAHANWQTLFEQAHRWRPRWITITDPETARRADLGRLNGATELLVGPEGIATMVSDPEVDVVVA